MKITTYSISLVLISVALLLLVVPAACYEPQKGIAPMNEYKGSVNAPEFPAGLNWLNTTSPLRMTDLRGKVVLLDFWTYCCINCIHIIPDLKKLEEKYADELVVVGVHSAKFTTERDTDNIRQAILRYEIEHPVINDSQMILWRNYGVRAWPTLILIDPQGKVYGMHSGEGIYEPFDKVIGEMIAAFDREHLIDRTPLAAIQAEHMSERTTLLRFPGKVLADADSQRLFIADSNNNRIVVVSLEDNRILDTLGGLEAGLVDGSFEDSRFDKPQGMALGGDTLYIADTENHSVRAADLKNRTVTTIAGTGAQAHQFNQDGPALETELSSPWDLELLGDDLFIANAGTHQLYVLRLARGYLEPYAGSGRENRHDGALLQAALAQPSGLTSDDNYLYFADSEVSAIRAASRNPRGDVSTVAGGELFEYGDNEAAGLEARFQHPLGVAYRDRMLYVADTYNNKIKVIDLNTGKSSTFAGTGREGSDDGRAGKATFDEPAGLSIAGEFLYVADTNNHLIRRVDLRDGSVNTLMIVPGRNTMARNEEPAVQYKKHQAIQVSPGSVTVPLEVSLPAGTKLNTLAPSVLTWSLNGETGNLDITGKKTPLGITVADGEAELKLSWYIYYCDEGNEGLCYFGQGNLLIPLKGVAGGNKETTPIVIAIE